MRQNSRALSLLGIRLLLLHYSHCPRKESVIARPHTPSTFCGYANHSPPSTERVPMKTFFYTSSSPVILGTECARKFTGACRPCGHFSD
jgi:hypothetical protein